MACYSVVNPSSFENVKSKWVPELRHHCPDVPIVLVGTKLDLREDADMVKRLQEKELAPITGQMAEVMKKEVNAVAWGECSARTQKGLKEVFNECIKCVLKPAVDDSGRKKKKGVCDLM